MHLVADHGNVGKSLQELEELGRLHDGVGIEDSLICFS
jgi:hypothetical protein